jgi:hypothetical protein
MKAIPSFHVVIQCLVLFKISIMRRKKMFYNWPCNSIFAYALDTYNSLQLYQNKSFSTTMQVHNNCTHDLMLTSLIVIHPLKSSTWHFEYFWIYIYIYISNIDLHFPLLLMMVRNCDTWHNKKLAQGLLIVF